MVVNLSTSHQILSTTSFKRFGALWSILATLLFKRIMACGTEAFSWLRYKVSLIDADHSTNTIYLAMQRCWIQLRVSLLHCRAIHCLDFATRRVWRLQATRVQSWQQWRLDWERDLHEWWLLSDVSPLVSNWSHSWQWLVRCVRAPLIVNVRQNIRTTVQWGSHRRWFYDARVWTSWYPDRGLIERSYKRNLVLRGDSRLFVDLRT